MRFVIRIERSAAAVPCRPIESTDQSPVSGVPNTQALGHPVVLRHPQSPAIVYRHPRRVVHVKRILESDRWRSSVTDRAKEAPIGRKHLDLLTAPPVADVERAAR